MTVIIMQSNQNNRPAESEVSGSNARAPIFPEQKPFLYHEWSGMVETYALYR